MNVLLVRHGETEDNRAGRYIGWLDPPLTDRGSCQAQHLTTVLLGRAVKPGFVLSSDLRRALDTARPVAAALEVPLKTDRALREINMGRWTGMTYEQLMASDPDRTRAWYDDPDRVAPPGGETLAQFRHRISTCLLSRAGEAAAQPQKADPAFIAVTHGGVIRVALTMWAGMGFWDENIAPADFINIWLPSQ